MGGAVRAKIDLAIVGGGIAGLYVAARLAARGDGHGRDIALFEASPELGGRIRSVTVPHAAEFPAELGAMRVPRSHKIAEGLLRHHFDQSELIPFASEDGLWHLREKRSTRLSPILRARYGFSKAQAAAGPGGLLKNVLLSALRETRIVMEPNRKVEADDVYHKLTRLVKMGGTPISLLTPPDWVVFKRHAVLETKGVKKRLCDIGFWNLMHHYMEAAEYQVVHDAFGYESIVSNWNAAEAIPWFLKDFGVEYVTPAAGMTRLTESIVSELVRRRDPDCVHRGMRAVEVVPERDGFQLTLENIENKSDLKRVFAREVVLALPKTALMRLGVFEGRAWLDRARKHRVDLGSIRAHLDSVSEHALFKLFLVFDEPWWREPTSLKALKRRVEQQYPGMGARARIGWRAITDEPLRQIYHFAVPKRTGGGHLGVVMASYSDEHYSDFWRPLARKVEARGVPGKPFCTMARLSELERIDLEIWGAPEGLVRKALGQLRSVHGLRTIPEPLVAYAKDWNDPFTHCGWHTWNPGARSHSILQSLRCPIRGVYICGEAYSTEQGWIEGALKSAELVLMSMGLDPPRWLGEHTRQSLEAYCLA